MSVSSIVSASSVKGNDPLLEALSEVCLPFVPCLVRRCMMMSYKGAAHVGFPLAAPNASERND